MDGARDDEAAWSIGNRVEPLVHGSAYFAALVEAVSAMHAGDLLLFCEQQGGAGLVLDEVGTEIAGLFSAAAGRRVLVRGLVWRPNLDRLRIAAKQSRGVGDAVDEVHGCCTVDRRFLSLGTRHQELVVLRHPGRPERDVAFVGGIEPRRSRHGDGKHQGDAPAARAAVAHGKRAPWREAHVALHGPAVRDVEAVFREHWGEPMPPRRNLLLLKRYTRERDAGAVRLPEQLPAPPACGPHAVELLRAYPRNGSGRGFAAGGDRAIAPGYLQALDRARDLIYLDNQHLRSREVAEPFARALRRNPQLLLIAVLPTWSDMPAGRNRALESLHEAGGDRVAVYGTTPVGCWNRHRPSVRSPTPPPLCRPGTPAAGPVLARPAASDPIRQSAKPLT